MLGLQFLCFHPICDDRGLGLCHHSCDDLFVRKRQGNPEDLAGSLASEVLLAVVRAAVQALKLLVAALEEQEAKPAQLGLLDRKDLGPFFGHCARNLKKLGSSQKMP